MQTLCDLTKQLASRGGCTARVGPLGVTRRPCMAHRVEHARTIGVADLTRPIILAAHGQVLDGMHRIAKALLSGLATVPAQRLTTDPDPDWQRRDESSR